MCTLCSSIPYICIFRISLSLETLLVKKDFGLSVLYACYTFCGTLSMN